MIQREITRKPLHVEVKFEGHPEMEVPVNLYAFTPEGICLANVPIKEGVAELRLADEEIAKVQLMVAPPLLTEQPLALDLVEKVEPFKPILKLDPDLKRIEFPAIPEAFSMKWPELVPLMKRVRVRGHLGAAFKANGEPVTIPVPHARVHIYEVDPRIPNNFKMEELATVTTDQHGYFDITITTLLGLDLRRLDIDPDLYFRAELKVNAKWIPIYAPLVGTGTFWNYKGQPVMLTINACN